MNEIHKKEGSIKELILQSEEDRKNIRILQETIDKLNEEIKMYKCQLEKQESISNLSIMSVNKLQHDLENAESRAEEFQSTLNQEKVGDVQEKEDVIKKPMNKVNIVGASSSVVTSSCTTVQKAS